MQRGDHALLGRVGEFLGGQETPGGGDFGRGRAGALPREKSPLPPFLKGGYRSEAAPSPRVIVGVIGDIRHHGIDLPVKRKFYIPDAQFGQVFGIIRSMTLVVKTSVPAADLAAPVRAAVGRLDPNLPLVDVRTLESVLEASVAEPRFTMLLMGLFAALALTLSAVGLYGVLSHSVGSRTREIGIRMALGAQRSGVRRMILRQGLVLAVTGTVLGIAFAFLSSRLIASLLYQVAPLDAWTFAAVPAVLILVAVLAVYLPARRATRIDPVTALRYE